MTRAEMKALHEAPTLDAACKLLGQFQEDRKRDGQLSGPVPQADQALQVLSKYAPLDRQVELGLKSTPRQHAHIQHAATPEEGQARTTQFLEERRAQNVQWFEHSRHWGAELDRQAREEGRPGDERIRGRGNTQGWRSDVAEQHRSYRAAANEVTQPPTAGSTNPPGGDPPPSPDPRFATAPMNRAEMKALEEAATPEAVSQLLGRFHEARLKDGRLPPTSIPNAEQAHIHQHHTQQEQTRLGLRPTAGELDYIQAAGQEQERTREFLAHRNAHNRRWFEHSRHWGRVSPAREPAQTHTQENADRRSARVYWYERAQNSTASAERAARTEKGERRTDLQQKAEQREQRREGKSPGDRDQGQQSRDHGGRER